MPSKLSRKAKDERQNTRLAKALRIVDRDWSSATVDFTCGNCHTLAVALYQAMNHTGVLKAAMRYRRKRGGAIVHTEYSHMVYETPHGTSWDIDGRNADGRWEESFGDEFVWIEVAYANYLPWLLEHDATANEALTEKLTNVLQPLLHK